MNEYPDYLESLPRAEYGVHIQKLQQGMGASGIDMLLLSSLENTFYVTGYRSWHTSSPSRPVLVSALRVREPAISLRTLEKSTVENISWCPNIYAAGTKSRNLGPLNSEGPADVIKKLLGELGYEVKTVGLEVGDGQHYVWSSTILKELTGTFPHLISMDDIAAIQGARMIKMPWEIDRIWIAGRVMETAIAETFCQIGPGITTEKDIARGTTSRMAAGGVDEISYLTINSGRDKYHTFNSYATDRIVDHKDTVLVDISSHTDGYTSGLTRVTYLGHIPPEQYARMAETARNCAHAGSDMLRPGVKVWEINQAIEGYPRGSRYGSNVVHSSGHLTGLNVTEYPNINDDCHKTVRAGMVFVLESGVYSHDLEKGVGTIWTSFRMEDEVLVTENGAGWLSGPGKALYIMGDLC